MDSPSYYTVLQVGEKASSEEIAAAFDERLAERRARRMRTGDLYAARDVLSTPALKRAYDLSRKSTAAGELLTDAKDKAVQVAKGAVPELDWIDIGRGAWQTTLKATVLVSGSVATASDFTGRLSRRVRLAAAARLSV